MKESMSKQTGISIIEYIIALTLVLIIITGWFKLTSYGIQNNHYVMQLGEMNILGRGKAQDVINDLGNIIPHLGTQTSAGSLTPGQLLPNYSDQLNESGCFIKADGSSIDCTEISQLPQTKGHTLSDSTVPRFTRQWLIKENFPDHGNITVIVRVERLGSNSTVRLFNQIKVDGIITK